MILLFQLERMFYGGGRGGGGGGGNIKVSEGNFFCFVPCRLIVDDCIHVVEIFDTLTLVFENVCLIVAAHYCKKV